MTSIHPFKADLCQDEPAPSEGSRPLVTIGQDYSPFAEPVVEEPVIEDLEAKKVEEHAAEIEVAPVVVGSRVEVGPTSISFRGQVSMALSRRRRMIILKGLRRSRQSR